MASQSPPSRVEATTVVGAGIAGLSAALILARSGHDVQIIEESKQAGGMLAPIIHDGLPLDRGSHRVHPQAHPLLIELTREAQWQSKKRAGTLVLNGRHLSYPLNPISFIRGLGVRTTTSMGFGWLKRPRDFRRTLRWEEDRTLIEKDEGFEPFVIRRVGEAAYRNFYEPYARKVWGVEPGELSQTVAKQRVSSSNPLQSILRKTEQHFLYPAQGMASLIDLMRTKLEEAGTTFITGQSYKKIAAEKGAVFYTGHLSDMVPDCTLHHRGLYLLHLTVPKEELGPTDTWYTPETKYWFGRVSQPALFSEALTNEKERVLCVEIPEGKWGAEKDFTAHIDVVMDQLHEARITQNKVLPSQVQQTFLPRVYPMYLRGWEKEQRRALKYIASKGPTYPCGRQGLFLHCNMDHAVATAAAAVEHWKSGGDSSSWAQRCQEFSDFRVRD